MERGRFAATSDIVIDACHHGDGLWIANGALSRMQEYAEHKAHIGEFAAQREVDVAWHRQTEAKRAVEAPAVQRALASRPARYGLGLSAGTAVIIAIRLLYAFTHLHHSAHQSPQQRAVTTAGANGTQQLQ